MKKILQVFFASLIALSLQATEKKVSSKLTRVKVYLSGAQVTREASTILEQGISRIVFSGLSEKIDPLSVQVNGQGRFIIASVTYRQNYLENEARSEEVSRLDAEKDTLSIKISEAKSALEAFASERSLLSINQVLGGKDKRVTPQELNAGADFYRTRLTEISLKELALNRNMKIWEERLDAIDSQLETMDAGENRPVSEIMVTVNAGETTPADFTLSYFVSEASWTPAYDVRVKEPDAPLELVYKATVTQNTGEKWDNVKLSLSTGNPTLSGSLPVIWPWFLQPVPDYRLKNGSGEPSVTLKPAGYQGFNGTVKGQVTSLDGEPLPGTTITIKGTNTGTVSDLQGNYSLHVNSQHDVLVCSFIGFKPVETMADWTVINFKLSEEVLNLQEVVVTGYGVRRDASEEDEVQREEPKPRAEYTTAEYKETATLHEYSVEEPYTVQSNSQPVNVRIQSVEMPATFEYYCTPKLDRDAFLVAHVTNWQNLNLQQANVSLFLEDAFVGNATLDVQNTRDTLDFSLGRDRKIIVKRVKKKDFTSRQTVGANQKQTIGWDITVRNTKNYPVRLNLGDQVPLTRTDEISVEVTDKGGAEYNKETGRLTWVLDLKPSATQKVSFAYTVKYPKNRRVSLE